MARTDRWDRSLAFGIALAGALLGCDEGDTPTATVDAAALDAAAMDATADAAPRAGLGECCRFVLCQPGLGCGNFDPGITECRSACTRQCAADADCPADGTCPKSGGGICGRKCDSDTDCAATIFPHCLSPRPGDSHAYCVGTWALDLGSDG